MKKTTILRGPLRTLCVLRVTAVVAAVRTMVTAVVVAVVGVALMCSACNEWLNVTPDAEALADEQFSQESGFRDALMGIYIKLATQNLYGENLTWRAIDILAQQYMLSSASMIDVALFTYDYEASVPINYINNIWNAQYNVIANINNILRYADRNKGVMHPIMDSVVRGECLAIRAYCHLDLMRLYGKGNYANRPELANQLTIPYAQDFSYLPPEQHTYKETFELLFNDLEQALKYLEADPIKSINNRPERYYDIVSNADNNYFINAYHTSFAYAARRVRMNYYACLGLYARALMWEGSPQSRAKALEIAKTVTNNGSAGNSGWYQWVTLGQLSDADYLLNNGSFIYEHLWSLYINNLWEYQKANTSGSYAYKNWFCALDPGGFRNVVCLQNTRALSLFESDAGLAALDWRYTAGLKQESANAFAIIKYREEDPGNGSPESYHGQKSEIYRKRMPLMRITELFYIAAECLADSDPAEATRYLNVVRNRRNIPSSLDLQGLTPAQVREEIAKEYMKEFIAEGQLFYYYKRLGVPYIEGYGYEMTDAQYVFPLPDNEVINGGRVPTDIN